MTTTALTEKQQEFVWNYICSKFDFDGEDENPVDVINNRWGGDREKYLQEMAEWHSIKFCYGCGRGFTMDEIHQENFVGFCDMCED